LKGKSQAVVNEAMRDILVQSKKENRGIKRLESDNGSEFVSKSFQDTKKNGLLDGYTTNDEIELISLFFWNKKGCCGAALHHHRNLHLLFL
jgi:hypothetical protein